LLEAEEEDEFGANELTEEKLNKTFMISFAITRAHKMGNCKNIIEKC